MRVIGVWTNQIPLRHHDAISLNDARDVVQTTFPTAEFLENKSPKLNISHQFPKYIGTVHVIYATLCVIL